MQCADVLGVDDGVAAWAVGGFGFSCPHTARLSSICPTPLEASICKFKTRVLDVELTHFKQVRPAKYHANTFWVKRQMPEARMLGAWILWVRCRP